MVLTLGVVLVGGMWLHGQPNPAPATKEKEKRTVTTSGSATIRIKPDSARLFLSVQTSASTIKDARAENAAAFKKVKAALTKLQIADLKMKTADVNLEPEYTRATERQPATVSGYRVTNQFTVLITDSDVDKLSSNASRVLDTALQEGVNVVSRVVFFKQDDTAARREVMSKAVEQAVLNAQALTAGVKASVAETVQISDTPVFSWGGNDNVQRAFNTAPGGEETQFVAGDMVVTCRVTVTCTY
jgi:uncharacterized protein YggE